MRILNVKEASPNSANVLLKYYDQKRKVGKVDDRKFQDFELEYDYAQDPETNAQIVELTFRIVVVGWDDKAGKEKTDII